MYGIVGKTLVWLEDYLNNRKQCTLANSVKSDLLGITCGVPQGSILGPLLFLLYVNDVEDACKGCKILLYADDTVLFLSGKNERDLNRTMQSELNSYYNWCHVNRLTVNSKKTKYMCFGV